MKWNKLGLIVLPLLLFSCDKEGGRETDKQEVHSYRVAVVLPETEKEELSKIIDWAQMTIKDAQAGMESRIELDLDWIDEDGPDMARRVAIVTHDERYTAVIGPEYSRSARLVARESLSYRIPVLMPSVTSTEFQRIYAGSNMSEPNIFCLSENDMSQCQALLSGAKSNYIERIALLSRDGKTDDYAASFQQFFAYMAREMQMSEQTVYLYEDKASLAQELGTAIEAESQAAMPGVLLFVPSSVQDMLDFDGILAGHDGTDFQYIVCPDIAHDPSLEGKLKYSGYVGTTLGSRPGEGFDVAWKTRYGTDIPGGYAQLYDCFYLLTAAIAAVESGGAASVREALVALTSGTKNDIPSYAWTASGMQSVFRAVKAGDYKPVTGVSGRLLFDEKTHICQMETTYHTWKYQDGKFGITGRFSRSYSGSDIWNWTTTQIANDFDDLAPDLPYPELTDYYAVVIATSTGWTNYRHQADALAQYQMLKEFGYDDDHIILILEDDIAGNPENPYPGVVHVTPGGENLRTGAVIDYKTSDVTPEDLANIFSGTVTERTPLVIHGSPGTNVFLFWSGHGARDNVLKWADNKMSSETIRGILEGAEGNYRKILAVMETCYSGSVGAYCEGLPGILFLCASASGETSHADVMDGGIYLSNRFTRVFRSEVEANPGISVHDLYYQLATHTTGSHAGIYNDAHYGNVYRNTLGEYWVERVSKKNQ